MTSAKKKLVMAVASAVVNELTETLLSVLTFTLIAEISWKKVSRECMTSLMPAVALRATLTGNSSTLASGVARWLRRWLRFASFFFLLSYADLDCLVLAVPLLSLPEASKLVACAGKFLVGIRLCPDSSTLAGRGSVLDCRVCIGSITEANVPAAHCIARTR